MNLLPLSNEIGSDDENKVIKLIHTDSFKPDVVHQHIKHCKEFMSIADGSVGQSLIHEGFQKNEEPYKTASDYKRKSFSYKKDVIEVLRGQLKNIE